MELNAASGVPSRSSARHRRTLIVTTVAVAAALVTGSATPSVAAVTGPVGLLPDSARPQVNAMPVPGPLEVGFTFSPAESGALSAVRFYQNASNSGVVSASVWSAAGVLLARAPVDPVAAVGWRTVPIELDLDADVSYTVSVLDNNGRIPAIENFFAEAKTTNGIVTPAKAGVYKASAGFPTIGQASSGLIDIAFTPEPDLESGPESPVEPTEPEPTEPAPTPTPTPVEPTPPAPDPAGPVSTVDPDGSHWPENTPRVGEARVVQVKPTWAAISAAINAEAKTADDVVVCVSPGTITGGNGAGSSSKGVIQDVGNADRASRILVTPCDGVGSVKTAGDKGVAFVGIRGVSIVGIDFGATSVMLRNVEAFGFGYTTVRTLLITANGVQGVRDTDVVEVVAGTEAAEGAGYDRMEVKSAGGYDIDGLTLSGLYAAPHYKARGSSAHTDTIQFVTTSGDGTITDVVIEDSAVFQSTNQGIIAGNNSGGESRNTLVVGGKTGQLRYPVYEGGQPVIGANSLHGTWSGLAMETTSVAGSVSPYYSFSAVEASESTKGDRGFSKLEPMTLDDLDEIAPVPTAERLAAIWG
ncbi:DUF4082 domain-containing protein [Microbacterium sp. Leaf151]|uniref:DUF4082 domain-containing protein n=1 Tax=Microbacterium sp. Leaf151 TaxID=1736276 RepID=UPI0006F4FF24|nr:DUF4082 domain-containing protein [Microbacterium sp. Leaf151]KQR25018.1 hypothetical protein ASF76_04990 [Microbacterium sp. Leaf151]